MSDTDHTGIGGGLREIDNALLDEYQAFSTGVVGLLGHNQQLIQDTLVPRHLINDYYPRDADGYALALAYDSYGMPIAVWGGFNYQPGYELRAKIRVRKLGAEYFDSDLYLISTPTMPDLDGYLPAILESVPAYLEWHVDSTTSTWIDGHMDPNIGNGNRFYLSLWSRPEEFWGAPAMLDLTCVCVRERRKRT